MEEALYALRPRMVRFFSARGRAWAAEDLADEAMLRALQKIRSGEPIENLEHYVLGICRLVLLEHLRDRTAREEPLPESLSVPQPEIPDSSLIDCLEWCLDRLEPDDRALILRFHSGGGVEPKNKHVRKRLAEELDLSMNALLLRASLLRGKLRKSIGDCLALRNPR